MRILTVKQPWAWAIIHGGKDVENRVRSLGPYRGPVAIHASRSIGANSAWTDPNVREALIRADSISDWNPSLGTIIGVVDLVDEHTDCTENVDGHGHTPTCSKWAMSDHHHLVLANPRPLTQPIPARGMLGLWRPDAELLAAITEQLAEVA